MASSSKIIIFTICLILSSSLLVEGFGKGHGNSGMGIAAILAAGLIAKLLENQHHHHHGCHHHHSAGSQLIQRIVSLRNPYLAESQKEQSRIAAIYHRLAESQKLQGTSQLTRPLLQQRIARLAESQKLQGNFQLTQPQLQQRIARLSHQRIADFQLPDAAESQLEQNIAAIQRRLAASKKQQRIAQLQQRIAEMEGPQLDESFRRGQY